MRLSKWVIISMIAFSSVGCDEKSEIYDLCHAQNIEPKREILSVVQNESDEIKALILAVASLETEHFTVNYPTCDGKGGKACNIGIFKMNIALLDKIIGQTSSRELQNKIHHDRKTATKIFAQGLKKLGHDDMLKRHRGGEGWQNYKSDIIDDYISAVMALQNKWLDNSRELNARTTSCRRYTIAVDGI